ncbi:MAG: tyrosine--tRNA ligase [Rhabdochlamydiaceae bacterium]|nr:tyrosine--tRNA ligase [Rhabdochlamydiaceae bacterium]
MKDLMTCLKERGLIENTTSEDLDVVLRSPIKAYIGFDPTADSLHLGNFVCMQLLAWFQRFGHTPVVVLGGATGKIGDPSGKSKERPLLDDATILHNLKCIQKNFERILDFSGNLPMPIFLNNADWFASFGFIDFLRDVGKHFRIGTMLAKESVRSRVQSEEGMSFTEFSYQLVQGYDFYHLFQEGVCLQMGGSDQWGNITAGIELIRKLSGKTAYGVTFPLLTRSDGKKFGKSEDGAIWLSEEKLSPYQLYQYLVRISDEDVISLLKKLTFLPLEEIHSIEESMKSAQYVPNTAQKKLAEELTKQIHGQEGLEKALRATQGASPGHLGALSVETIEQIAQDLPNTKLAKEEILHRKFTEIAVLSGLLSSKGEGVRLIQNQGAYLNHVKVESVDRIIEESDLIGGKFILLGSGKKKQVLVRVQS